MDVLLRKKKSVHNANGLSLVSLLFLGCVAASALPMTVHGAAAFVQDTEAFQSGSAPVTTAAFASNTTSGNLIVVAASWDGCGNAEASDNKGNTYVAATVKEQGPGAVICSQIFYAEDITGGASHTVTISATSGTVEFIKVVAHEVSGAATSDALDKNASGTSSGASQSVGPVTTTTDGQYIFATASEENQSNNNFSASGSFTERETADQSGSWHTQTQDYVQPTAGSISATWTASSGSSQSTVQMATFHAQGAQGSTSALVKPANYLGLVGYWSMDDGSGSIATDFSGRGNHGSFTNMEAADWVTQGKRGGAVNLDGDAATEYINLGQNVIATGAMTACAWVKGDAFTTGGSPDAIIVKANSGGSNIQYSLNTSVENSATTKTIEFFWSDNGGSEETYVTSDTISTGTWYHICGVRSAAGVGSIYIDGTSRSVTPSGNVTPTTNNATDTAIGRPGEISGNFYWDGLIDEVRFYNRELDATEIASLYTLGATRIGASSKVLTQGTTLVSGLVGLWTFDGGDVNWTSGTGGTVADASGNGNTGTITNMVRTSAVGMGKLGQAFLFDGIDDYLEVADDASLLFGSSEDFSVFAWIKAPPIGTSYTAIVGKKLSRASNRPGYLLAQEFDGTIRAYIADGIDEIDAVSSASIDDNEWHYVGLTASRSGNVTIYIDGVANGSTDSMSAIGDVDDAGVPLQVGDIGFGGQPFGGFADDVRVYSRVLTANEIKQLYYLGQVRIVQ